MAVGDEARTAAWAEAHDPATTAGRLAEIACSYPEFAGALMTHPNVYPELAAWAVQAQAAAQPPRPEEDAPRVVDADAHGPGVAHAEPARTLLPASALTGKPEQARGGGPGSRALHGVGVALGTTVSVVVTLYGLALVIIGVIGMFVVPAAWGGGLLIIAYGIYLMLPGRKFVVW